MMDENLKFAIENGIIDMQYLQEQIKMSKRMNLLNNHPYEIWQGNNKCWYTYLPDEVKGRVQRQRRTKKEIEDVIIEYWKQQEENPTVKTLFNEWIYSKLKRDEIERQTYERYVRQFDQCFKEIAHKRIRSITPYNIEEFVLDCIHKNELTNKGYSNMRTLLYGIFKLAKKKRLVDYSITEVVKDMDISRKSFRKTIKDNSKEVFSEEELPKVYDYLMENMDIINLGIMLIFKSGLRVGELSGLKKEDINGNIIHVGRTEIFYSDEHGKRVYEVRDFPKTDAGIRDVYLPDKALWIIKRIKMMNPFGEYLFEIDGERIRSYRFRDRLYDVCKAVDIVEKSPHKARKTYGTVLVDSGAPDSFVIAQMGHTDINTTRKYYYKDRKDGRAKTEMINSVIGL